MSLELFIWFKYMCRILDRPGHLEYFISDQKCRVFHQLTKSEPECILVGYKLLHSSDKHVLGEQIHFNSQTIKL